MTGPRFQAIAARAGHPPGAFPSTAAGPRPARRRPSRRQRDDAPRIAVLDERHHAACTAHLLALDMAARCNRFWCAVDDDYILRYAAGLRRDGHLLVGVLQGGRVVGLAHVAPYPEGEATATEIGISIDAAARGRGLGRRLLRAALDAAAQHRAGRVHVLFRGTNTAMAALARGLGGRIGHEGCDAYAVFELPAEVPAPLPASAPPSASGAARLPRRALTAAERRAARAAR